jgi:CzcA family heavy metal efflux pump
MLSAIVHFSLRFRGIVVALAAVLLAYGCYVAEHAKLDVFPDFVPPEVTVQAEAPGLTAEQVETLVTRPIESAINGLGSLDSMRSESIQGLSIITVVFQDGTKILPARQLLAEKLGEIAGGLPAGVHAPTMSALTSATMDLLKIGLVSDRLSPMELRTFADWTLKPRLLAVAGVAQCNVFGGEVLQWQIQVHPDQLMARGLTLEEVLAAARLASGVRGAGFIETKNERVVLETEAPAVSVEMLGNIVVAAGPGAPVRLRDIAAISQGAEPKFGDAQIQGRPGVLMTMLSTYGANTMEATRGLEAALDDLRPVFARQGITLYPALQRPATFIEASLDNIRHSLLVGAVLVAVILFLFLGNIRTALVSLSAIPLSLFAAIVVLDRLGVTLNTITLGGLAIAIGEVVDDAIIDVENILRRLRENRTLVRPRPVAAVVLDASLEVRSAVVYATFSVALVFLPVLTLSGLQGAFFAPLAQSYILAIMASLGMALTVTPALSLLLFARSAAEAGPPRLQVALRSRYERLLGWVSRHTWPVVGTVTLLCAGAFALIPLLGGDFLPEFREGHFVTEFQTAPGASLAETMRLGRIASVELLKNPNIDTVEQQIGRAERGEDTQPPNWSELHVELKPHLPGKVQAEVEDDIRRVLSGISGVQYDVTTFLGDRIGETIGGEVSPVVISVFGDDLDLLDAKAREIRDVLAAVPGAADVQLKSPPGAPRIAIRLRADRLTALGFRPLEVLDEVETAYEGEVVGQAYKGSQISDIAVILDPAKRRDPEAVGDLFLTSFTGVRVRLREIADVYLASARSSILHEGARRRQTVTCAPSGRDLQAFVADARAAITGKVTMPAGMYVEFAGAAEQEAAASRELLVHSALALTGILILLSVVLGHWRNLALVLINLPLALAGGVVAIYLAGVFGSVTISMGALVGFVTLFGITTRNSIMLISHYHHLVHEEGQTWNLATTIRGASERLVPILMTASVTMMGLLPLAIGTGEAGREIEGPMAIVILGGLVTSTILNLLVLPTLALRWARWKDREEPGAPDAVS